MRALVLLALIACQVPAASTPVAPVVMGPTGAARSTFKLEIHMLVDASMFDMGELELDSSATAWIARTEHDRSLLVTAGHACPVDIEAAPGIRLPLVASYTLLAQDGTRHPAVVVRRADDPDICVLAAEPLGPALPISPVDPVYDEPVAYVGAPSGAFGNGLAPMFRGHYAGGDYCSIPTAGGASGSAIFTASGVVGVLVRVNTRFHHLTAMESRSELVEFLTGL